VRRHRKPDGVDAVAHLADFASGHGSPPLVVAENRTGVPPLREGAAQLTGAHSRLALDVGNPYSRLTRGYFRFRAAETLMVSQTPSIEKKLSPGGAALPYPLSET